LKAVVDATISIRFLSGSYGLLARLGGVAFVSESRRGHDEQG
jgi:hypothetical protein